jgi:hypothetical protein
VIPTAIVAALLRAIASATFAASGKRMAVVITPPNAKQKAGKKIGYMPNRKRSGKA